MIRAEKYKAIAHDATRLSNDLGKIFYAKAFDAAIASKNDSMIAIINLAGSIPYINTAKYAQAQAQLESSLRYWQLSDNALQLSKCHTVIGYLERAKGNSYLALENLYKAKAIREKIAPLYEMWDITNRLMINYSALGELDKAITIGEEFLGSARKLEKKPTGYYTILRNTGEIMFKNGDTNIAQQYIREALPILKQRRYPKFLAQSFNLLSDIALEEGHLELAKIYADSNLIYCNQYKSPIMLCNAHLTLFNVLEQLQQPEKLQYHVQSAVSKARESKHKATLLSAAKTASKFETKQDNFKIAFEYQNLADSLREELFSEETAAKIKELEKKLAIEKSQEEVRHLKEQNDLKAQNLEKADTIRKFLIGSLALTPGGCFLIYLLLRQRSKNNYALQKKNDTISVALSEKETLLREIHHRVKNNLQFISSLLGLQTEHVKDKAALDALQDGQDRVQSMALIHQNLYQENNLTGVDVKDYFIKLIQGLFDSYNIYDDRIELELDIEDINLDVDTVIPIGLIVNELISNSLKYAFPQKRRGKIEIRMREEEKVLHLTVTDNGIGMTSEQIEKLGVFRTVGAICYKHSKNGRVDPGIFTPSLSQNRT